MKLNDEVIINISKILQLALLTGCDIVDYLRQVELFYDEKQQNLVLTEEYKQLFENNLLKMTQQLEGMTEDNNG